MILLRQKGFSEKIKSEQKEFTKKRILAKKGKQIYNELKSSVKGFEKLERVGNSYTYGFDKGKIKKVNAIESLKNKGIKPDKLKALNEYENQLHDKLGKELRHSWGGRNRKGSGKAYRRKLSAQRTL